MNKCVKDIKIPDYNTVCTDGGEREAAISGDCVQFDDVCVEFAKDGEHCAIFLTAQTSPVRWLKLRWNNMKWEIEGQISRRCVGTRLQRFAVAGYERQTVHAVVFRCNV